MTKFQLVSTSWNTPSFHGIRFHSHDIWVINAFGAVTEQSEPCGLSCFEERTEEWMKEQPEVREMT